MNDIINKVITLQLNSAWQPLCQRTVGQAIISMNSSPDGENQAAVGVAIEYEQLEDGSYDFSKVTSMIPLPWDEWIKLPVRACDFAVHSCKLTIRAPTVIIAVNYSKMPRKYFRATPKRIMERDDYTCQYTGEKLSKDLLDLDHCTPRSRGGRDTFENLVTCSKKINREKGARTPAEAGLKLIRPPRAPLSIPASALMRDAKHRDWEMFLLNKGN